MSSLIAASALDQLSLSLGKAGYFWPAVAVGGAAYGAITATVQEKGVGNGNAHWNVYSTVLGTLIGKFYWGESINGKDYLGLGLCVVGLYLLNGVE
jgi:multidrug transporter EmrE-like cation transporter